MAYVLTEEQQFLKDSAKDLFKMAPVALVRKLRDNNSLEGYSVDLWSQMVEMGWPCMAVSEEHGGLDFGLRAVGILMEESGRSLSASPLMSVLLSTQILEKYGSERQKKLISESCETGKIVAIAIQEGRFYDPSSIKVTAEKIGDGYIISGTKDVVLDAHVADSFIIVAKTEEGPTVFLLNKKTEGLSIQKEFLMDSRYYSKIQFDYVKVAKEQIIGKLGGADKIINDITSISSALLSAELIGVMSEAFDRSIAYLKERRQFGKEIGSFQGLQHRAADLYGEIQIAESLSIKALVALDEGDFMAPAYCSMAKAKCIKIANLATNEGVQMFGGIGMTDDEEIGFFMKRARVLAQLFGGYSYHLDRFARMSGY